MPKTHGKDAHRSRPLSHQVDLNLLELFETVYRTRNLTAAGARLGLSQPAVSRGLGRLREAYGDALFVRQQRGVSPTPLADALIRPVTAALETVRSTLERPTFDQAQQARVFRVALSDVGERIFLPRLMEHLAHAAPQVGIEVVSPSQDVLQEGLASGGIDLAVGFFGTLSKQVHHLRLFEERFVYIARQGHPAVKGSLKREQLRGLAHVIGGPEGMQHAAAVEKVLASPRVRARVALRVHSLLCVGPVVAESDLVGLVPGNLAAVVAGNVPIQRIEPPVPMPGFEVTMVWHERFHRDPANEWLRGVFVALFEGWKLPAAADS
ncbi:MAG TPA: LysR family transcriptional regulator [Ramlibacter sp.]|jgi:DNA-binding transcriptional LysR family regulator|nr:LysR family transcriptional regulator [Ramlibacter sp.]